MSRLPAALGSIASVFVLLVLTGAIVNSGGAPSGRTGAPGSLTCADTGCHGGNALNADGGSMSISAPASYTPGTPVDVSVRVERAGAARFGFSITVQDANQQMVGSWELINGQGTVFSEFGADVSHVTHSPAVTIADEHTWQLRWNPPSQDAGPITFYAAGNAANGAQGSAGDFIYTSSLSVASAAGVATEHWQVIPFAVDAVYPVPTSDELRLDVDADAAGPVTIHVYDAAGRSRIVETVQAHMGANSLRIDTSALSAGTYLWRVVMKGHSRTGVLPVTR